MSGHTIPITKYFRLHKLKLDYKNKNKVKIIKETLVSDKCI